AAQFGGIPQRKVAALGAQRYSAALGGVDISADLKDGSQPHREIPVGKLSPIQENDSHYYTMAVIEKGKDRLKLASVAWRKEPLRSWLAKAEVQAPASVAAVSANYALPVIVNPSGACTDDTWTPTGLTDVPDAREFPTAVWTGSEMIVWGGYPQLNTGGRYDPPTDSWAATSTANAPVGRELHTAVWTGTEMIVWGGLGTFGDLNTGGRYNPNTDTWAATSLINVPTGRDFHTAVWTGTEMIVWGGAADASGG